MFRAILSRCQAAVRSVARVLRRTFNWATRLVADTWRSHRALVNGSPAYDAIVAGAAVELVRLQRLSELLTTLVSAALAIHGVLKRRASPTARRRSVDPTQALY